MQLVHLILAPMSGVMLIWALVRWRTAAPGDADYGARRDVAVLLGLSVAGVLGDAIRARFPEAAQLFNVISAILVVIGIGAIVMLVRLIRAYRQSGAAEGNKAGRGSR